MASEPAAQSEQLASYLAARLHAAREELVQRWLERITARVTLDQAHIFPTDELLNHVPLLIDGIADYLEHPDEGLGAEAPVVGKAMELGALRHTQGFDAYEILKEQEILGAVVFSFLGRQLDDAALPGTKKDLAICWQRIAMAMELIRQATMTHFLRLWGERVNEREERLRRFNRMVSHELKNRVGAVRGAGSLLAEPWIETLQRDRFIRMVQDNAAEMQRVLDNLESLSRIDSDTRQRHNVLLPQAVTEVVRQLRDAARSRGVVVRVPDDLPAVEVDAAAVELALVNYISNAIKYSDPSRGQQWVAVRAELRFGVRSDGGAELVVWIQDNGLGVPVEARERLFEQFYRAHGETVTDVEGSGLGLSIVRETVETMGGRAWAEFPEEGGTTFAFALPSRRAEDAAAAGTKRVE